MKKIIISALVLLPIIALAQSFTGLTFEQAQEQAVAHNKIILVDVASSGTIDDKKSELEKSVLEVEGTQAFIEKNIVSIRMDMGTPEGKKFAPLLQMNMYPTYAFLLPNGDMIGTLSPFSLIKKPELFLEKAVEFKEKAEDRIKNTRKIVMSDLSFEDALVLAKKEKKLIFLDAYTDNCQPCIMMEKNVFTQDKVADFYNDNFINLSMNLGTEHTNLAEKYGATGYPSFLFIDGNGKLISFESGLTTADKFLQYGKDALRKSNIQFTQGSWKDVLDMAAKQNKPIFVDCYTVWCGPCKQMDANVFTDPLVAEYFNSNFINVKVDMEKDEGVELAKHYDIRAFPTFLYLDKEGNVLNVIAGGMSASEFLETSKKGMSEFGLSAMSKRYEAGERSEEFIDQYLKVLGEAYMQKEAQEVVVEFFENNDVELVKEKKYWDLFAKHVEDANSDVFKYVHANKPEFYALFGETAVERQMFLIWSVGSRSFVSKTDDGVNFDSKGFKKYIKRLKREKALKQDLIVANAKIHNAEQLRDWKTYISIIESRMKKSRGIEHVNANELYNWGLRIDQNCADNKYRQKAAKWFATMVPILKEAEEKKQAEAKKGGFMPAMSMVNYEKEFTRLSISLNKSIETEKLN